MEQQFYKGDIALLEIASKVYVQVKVLDVVRAYGKIRYLITPIAGSGEFRVEFLNKLKSKK